MTTSLHSLQSTQAQKQTEQAVQPPKNPQAQDAAKLKNVQDTVTISQEARQALTHNTTDAGGGGPNDYAKNQ